MILGVQWLETLGTIVVNWKSQMMEFEFEGKKKVKFTGDSTSHSRISLQAMIRSLQNEGGGVWVEINHVERAKNEEKEWPKEIPVAWE